MRPLIVWRILGAYFLLIWGVGVVKIVFNNFVDHGNDLIVDVGKLNTSWSFSRSLRVSEREREREL